MSIDLVALRTNISMEEARYVLALNPFKPLSRNTIDQMIVSGKLQEPRRRGKFKVWSKKYIAEKEDMEIEDINNILREIEKMKAG
ncbi:MAG: hypothetical protein ACRCXK_08490 [Wohlfahrtiimonas sp.]